MALSAFACFAILPAATEDVTVTPSAVPSEVASDALDAIAKKQHPYLLYENDEVPALKEKIKSGYSQKAFTIIEKTVSSCMNRGFTVAKGANGTIGRQLQYCVMYLSTYAMLVDQESYAYKAVEQVTSCATQGSVDVYASINDALCVGDFGYAYALAYDVLYEYMTTEERELVKAEMEEIGDWLYKNSSAINTWGADEEARKAWNWNVVTHGALGMISLSLGDHQEWLTLSVERMQGYYQYSVDSTGAGMEGLHYIGYALNTLAPFDNAIYRLTDIELMDDFPAFQSMTYWSMLYMTVPQGGDQVAINQGDSLGNYSGPFYIINRYSQSTALWAFAHTYSLEGDGEFNTEYIGNGWSAPAIIYFEDQSLEETAPTEEKNPLLVSYDKGLVVARDSWDNDASMFTFTCGKGYQGCWNHPDDSTFTFHARGESYIIDLGANYKASSDHNVVLIDGKGMDYEGGPTMREGVIEENKALLNGALYLRGNNISSYKNQKLKSSIRQVIYSGGDVPFVLVYDFVRKDGSDHTFNVNFFTNPSATVLAAPDGDYAMIIGTSGEICYAIPYSPEGATISFSTVNSVPCLTTELNASYMRQATLFIMAEPDGEMPEVEWSTEGKNMTVTITRTVNGQKETETYTLSLEDLVDFTTTQEIEIPVETTETEEIVVVETTAAPEIIETEEKVETTAEEIVTEKVTEEIEVIETTEVETTKAETAEIPTETDETLTEKAEVTTDETLIDDVKKGCGSSLGTIAIIPVTIIGASLIGFKKKKKK